MKKYLARLLLSKYRKKLLEKKNVNGIGPGLKIKDGKVTNEYCILVGVRKKESLSKLKEEDKIPKSIFGIKTDVLEIGDLEYKWRKKHRPLKLGSSACWEKLTACSLGLPVYIKKISSHSPNWVKEQFKVGDTLIQMNKHCTHPDENRGKWQLGDLLLNPSPLDGGKRTTDGFAELTSLFFPVSVNRKDNIDVSWSKVKPDMKILHEDVEGNKYIEKVRPLIENVIPHGDILKNFIGGSRTIQKVKTSSGIISVDYESHVGGFENGKDVVRVHPHCVLALNSSLEDGSPIVQGGCSSSIRFIDQQPLIQIFAGSDFVAVGNQVYRSIQWLRNIFGIEVSLTPIVEPTQKYYVAAGRDLYLDLPLGKTKTTVRLNLRSEPKIECCNRITTLSIGTPIEIINKIGYQGGYYWVEVKVDL